MSSRPLLVVLATMLLHLLLWGLYCWLFFHRIKTFRILVGWSTSPSCQVCVSLRLLLHIVLLLHMSTLCMERARLVISWASHAELVGVSSLHTLVLWSVPVGCHSPIIVWCLWICFLFNPRLLGSVSSAFSLYAQRPCVACILPQSCQLQVWIVSVAYCASLVQVPVCVSQVICL